MYYFMAQQFFITKGSTLPNLRLEMIHDGRHDFRNVYLALQNADVTFTMTELSTGIRHISNAPAYVVEKTDSGCEEAYVIEYRWNKRDTSQAGTYIGQFRINFKSDIRMEGFTFPSGEMIVPIAEDLLITISDSNIKR